MSRNEKKPPPEVTPIVIVARVKTIVLSELKMQEEPIISTNLQKKSVAKAELVRPFDEFG